MPYLHKQGCVSTRSFAALSHFILIILILSWAHHTFSVPMNISIYLDDFLHFRFSTNQKHLFKVILFFFTFISKSVLEALLLIFAKATFQLLALL